jgi:hypothetical protein
MLGLIIIFAGLIGLGIMFPWLWFIYLVFIGMAIAENR